MIMYGKSFPKLNPHGSKSCSWVVNPMKTAATLIYNNVANSFSIWQPAGCNMSLEDESAVDFQYFKQSASLSHEGHLWIQVLNEILNESPVVSLSDPYLQQQEQLIKNLKLVAQILST